MGGEHSQLPQTPVDFPFFSITFRRSDKLKLVNCSDARVADAVRTAIVSYWPGGLQREENELGCLSFKLSGYPFSSTSSSTEAVAVRRLSTVMLGNLKQLGWQLVASTDLSRTQDLTTWFFQRNPAVIDRTSPQPIVCLSISSYDKLHLVNAPQYLFDTLRQCVAVTGKLQSEEVISDGVYKVKITGYPWSNASFEEGIMARRILLNVFREFDKLKHNYLGSCNVKGTADCMFFQRDESVVPGEQRFACLSLNANDRLRTIDLPDAAVDVIRACVQQYWLRGMQEEISHPNGVHELKMNGYPWNCYGDDATAARLLMTTIFQALLAQGWAIHTALDISRRVNDKGIFILRSCTPASLPHMAFAPEDSDKIRMINAPQQVLDIVANVITQYWPYGVQRQNAVYGGVEWKLKGNPWHPYSGNEYLVARNMIACMLAQLASTGWQVVCSADVSAKYYHRRQNNHTEEYPLDVHTMFFVQTGAAALPAKSGAEPSAPAADSTDAAPPSYNEAVDN